MRVHGASLIRVKGEQMTQLNGELVYAACSPQEIVNTTKHLGRRLPVTVPNCLCVQWGGSILAEPADMLPS